jgi:hypothetical protein
MNFFEISELVKNTPLPKTKLQWEYSDDTFKSWLMSEITKAVAKDLTQWQNDNSEELPFSDLFPKERFVPQQELGDKMTAESYPVTRRVVPFSVAPEAVSILNKIHQNGWVANLEDGTVIMPKKGQEANYRKMRLGKVVLDKKSPFSEEEKKWWINSGNPMP